MKLPRGKKFKVIYADPPWSFMTYNGAKVPARGEQPYETMSLKELKALAVEEIADDDCLLIMWTVSSHVLQAFELAEAWGFKFKSLGFVWEKTCKSDPEKLKIGMGKWLRQECEISLIFARGKPKRVGAGVRQVIRAPAREHSRKPDEAYPMIEELIAGPYLELFSRTDRKGWTAWGNEVGKFSGRPQRRRAAGEAPGPRRTAAELLG